MQTVSSGIKEVIESLDKEFYTLRVLYQDLQKIESEPVEKQEKDLKKDARIVKAVKSEFQHVGKALEALEGDQEEHDLHSALDKAEIPPLKILHEGGSYLKLLEAHLRKSRTTVALRKRYWGQERASAVVAEIQEFEEEIKKLEAWVLHVKKALQSIQAYYQSQDNPFPLPLSIRKKIKGVSWVPACPVPLKDLSYLTPTYINFSGTTQRGELIVHKSVAVEIAEIFQKLHKHKFPIAKMKLIDEYGADDVKSVTDNNTSAFVYRKIVGQAHLSYHAYGLAIDINPVQNPYLKGKELIPHSAREFLDRRKKVLGMITKSSVCYQLFVEKGWEWGGNWTSLKDYQHFQKKF